MSFPSATVLRITNEVDLSPSRTLSVMRSTGPGGGGDPEGAVTSLGSNSGEGLDIVSGPNVRVSIGTQTKVSTAFLKGT
jgi:hypothetical protein